MALTFTLVKGSEVEAGRVRQRTYDITLDASYPTGGEAISGKDVGLLTIYGMADIGGNATAGGYKFHWDTTNSKLMVFTTGGSTIAAHSHDLLLKDAAVADGATTRVNAGTNLLGANTGGDLTVAGGGANGGVQNASLSITGGAASEVANATDLSTLTVRVTVTGV